MMTPEKGENRANPPTVALAGEISAENGSRFGSVVP